MICSVFCSGLCWFFFFPSDIAIVYHSHKIRIYLVIFSPGNCFSYVFMCLPIFKMVLFDEQAKTLVLSTRTDTQAFSTLLEPGYILSYILLLLKISNKYFLI